jgi:type I restriction enzyme S subunit
MTELLENYVRIGTICELINGRAFKPTDWTKDGLPIVRIQNLNNPEAPFNRFNGEVRSRFLIDRGDLLFAWSGTPGTSFGAHVWNGGPAILNQHIFNVRFDEKRVNKLFLQFALNQKLGELINKAHGGVGLQHVTKGVVENTEIYLPSLEKQKRIVDLLSRAEGIVRLRREAQKKAAAIIPALFIDMFGDPAKNPKGWSLESFGTIGSLDRGKSRHRPRDAAELYGGPYPFIQTGDVANSGGRITRSSNTYSEAGLQQSKLWPKGTLCITIAANIANTGILEFDGCFPDSVVGFLPGDKITTT